MHYIYFIPPVSFVRRFAEIEPGLFSIKQYVCIHSLFNYVTPCLSTVAGGGGGGDLDLCQVDLSTRLSRTILPHILRNFRWFWGLF